MTFLHHKTLRGSIVSFRSSITYLTPSALWHIACDIRGPYYSPMVHSYVTVAHGSYYNAYISDVLLEVLRHSGLIVSFKISISYLMKLFNSWSPGGPCLVHKKPIFLSTPRLHGLKVILHFLYGTGLEV